MKMLQDKILARQVEAEKVSTGGIIIPDSAQKAARFADVLEVGPGTDESPMMVKPGDRVVYTNFGGTEIQHDGEKLLVLRMTDILGVFDE